MKRISQIVAYLPFFVILATVPLAAEGVSTVYEMSQDIHLVKDTRFATGFQYGYRIAQGVQLETPDGLVVGVAGTVTVLPNSPLMGGIDYRGLTGLGGRFSVGYVHRLPEASGTGWGIAAGGQADYARYRDTNLFFFYPSLELMPYVTFIPDPGLGVRLSLAFRYYFRMDLEYHISAGISIAFLL